MSTGWVGGGGRSPPCPRRNCADTQVGPRLFIGLRYRGNGSIHMVHMVHTHIATHVCTPQLFPFFVQLTLDLTTYNEIRSAVLSKVNGFSYRTQ